MPNITNTPSMFVPPTSNVFDPQQALDIKRKRLMAEQMMKSGEQPTGTEVVSGFAVKQSPWAALAKAKTQGIGGYVAGQADSAEAEQAKAMQVRMAAAVNTGKLDSLAQGSPDEQMLALKNKLDDQQQAQRYTQELQLKKMGSSGSSGGGAIGALADRLIGQGVPPLEAILIAKSGAGVGNTYSNGGINPMAGKLNTAQDTKYAETEGKNLANIANAAEIERQKKIGSGELTDINKRNIGQEQVSSDVEGLREKYKQLNNMGGVVDPSKSALENAAVSLKSSELGQGIGKVTGSQEQSIRNEINMKIPTLINSIRSATGMSAKAMDSNAELQFYLKMATDPKLDINANLEALNSLQQKFGASQLPNQSPGAIPQAGQTIKGHIFNGGDPSDPNNWKIAK